MYRNVLDTLDMGRRAILRSNVGKTGPGVQRAYRRRRDGRGRVDATTSNRISLDDRVHACIRSRRGNSIRVR